MKTKSQILITAVVMLLSFLSSKVNAECEESVKLTSAAQGNSNIKLTFSNTPCAGLVYLPIILEYHYYLWFEFDEGKHPRFIGKRVDWANTRWDLYKLQDGLEIVADVDLSKWYALKKGHCYKLRAKYSVDAEKYKDLELKGLLGLPANLWNGTITSNMFEVCI